jgi:hypothetical protein
LALGRERKLWLYTVRRLNKDNIQLTFFGLLKPRPIAVSSKSPFGDFGYTDPTNTVAFIESSFSLSSCLFQEYNSSRLRQTFGLHPHTSGLHHRLAFLQPQMLRWQLPLQPHFSFVETLTLKNKLFG